MAPGRMAASCTFTTWFWSGMVLASCRPASVNVGRCALSSGNCCPLAGTPAQAGGFRFRGS
eukprot:2385020-Pyramimonas_sp.AAC.1